VVAPVAESRTLPTMHMWRKAGAIVMVEGA
jgi:hypothetical protein